MVKAKRYRFLIALVILFLVSLSCNLPKLETTVGPSATPNELSEIVGQQPGATSVEATKDDQSSQQTGGLPHVLPTPDPFQELPSLRTEPVEYTIRANDTLERIARVYWIGLNTLIEANDIENPELIQPGDVLLIPAPAPKPSAPGFKILPDSEVVYGPSSVSFDLEEYISQQNGFLAGYSEDVEGTNASSSQIILRVSQDYSVNPRLLIALLEYFGGWVTQESPTGVSPDYPLGYINASYRGLFRQLNWAANEINRGYYLWRVNGVPAWITLDESIVPPDPHINAGTAGILHVLSKLLEYQQWLIAVDQEGLYHTYSQLFGYPFDRGVEPLVPVGLTQPALHLPFEPGETWRFTGGPHGAFNSGTAWAALDFAPPGEALGCVQSDAWVTAMSDGQIIRSGRGQVIQDLDGDGNEQTGWVLVYLHIETRDRIDSNVFVQAGDRIGHPSCEGGISTGTHVHIARRYNGEWIPADQDLPFNLDGWISSGTGIAYNGYLTKNGQMVTALTGNRSENQITRE